MTVSRPVRLGIGLPFGAHLYPFSSDNCFAILTVGRPLWREDGVTCSAIAGWSGH
jgi:hypothetical protein